MMETTISNNVWDKTSIMASSSESPSSELLGFPPLSKAYTLPLLQLLVFNLSLTRPVTLYKVSRLGFVVGLSLNDVNSESNTICT